MASSSANLDKLSKPPKRAARKSLKSDLDIPSATWLVYRVRGWLPLESRIKYTCTKGILTYELLNNMTPHYITRLLTPMSHLLIWVHCICLFRVLFSTAVHFSCSVPRFWNSLPLEIRNPESINAFKTRLVLLVLAD